MLKAVTEVVVEDVTRREMFDFMLYCTDEDYQEWWPGTHLAFHTIKRTPDNLNNLVYFDEYIGRIRLRSHAVVTALVDAVRIVWQLKMRIHLPVWVRFELEDHPEGILVRHTLLAGFPGPGRLLDPLFKIYLTENIIQTLDEHARTEFPMLAEILAKHRVARG